jgi:3-deoxy-manno-octulosonate cytidylyltransferase (CMP-KDO synthetase)
MTTLAVIPARLASTRLARKPLRLLGGVPLVVRVWERVRDLGVADRIVVATDSDEVARAAREAGAEVAMTREDHPSGTDRVAEVAARPAYAGASVILNVQGDEPFVDADALRGAVACVRSGMPVGTAAAPVSVDALANPDVVKVVCDDAGRALYFSRAPIPYLRAGGSREHRDALVRQHVGVYAYSPDALRRWVALPPHPLELVERLEQLRPLAAGIAIGVASLAAPAEPGIDTEDDLARAEARWQDLFAGRT